MAEKATRAKKKVSKKNKEPTNEFLMALQEKKKMLKELIDAVKSKKSLEWHKDFDFDFTYDNENKSNLVAIKILTGKYAGVVFRYVDSIQVADKENPDGSLSITFECDILEPLKFDKAKLKGNKKFEKIVGDILISIIMSQAVETVAKEIEKDEEAGNDYTEEFDSRRRVRQKSSTVSE